MGFEEVYAGYTSGIILHCNIVFFMRNCIVLHHITLHWTIKQGIARRLRRGFEVALLNNIPQYHVPTHRCRILRCAADCITRYSTALCAADGVPLHRATPHRIGLHGIARHHNTGNATGTSSAGTPSARRRASCCGNTWALQCDRPRASDQNQRRLLPVPSLLTSEGGGGRQGYLMPR